MICLGCRVDVSEASHPADCPYNPDPLIVRFALTAEDRRAEDALAAATVRAHQAWIRNGRRP